MKKESKKNKIMGIRIHRCLCDDCVKNGVNALVIVYKKPEEVDKQGICAPDYCKGFDSMESLLEWIDEEGEIEDAGIWK